MGLLVGGGGECERGVDVVCGFSGGRHYLRRAAVY